MSKSLAPRATAIGGRRDASPSVPGNAASPVRAGIAPQAAAEPEAPPPPETDLFDDAGKIAAQFKNRHLCVDLARGGEARKPAMDPLNLGQAMPMLSALAEAADRPVRPEKPGAEGKAEREALKKKNNKLKRRADDCVNVAKLLTDRFNLGQNVFRKFLDRHPARDAVYRHEVRLNEEIKEFANLYFNGTKAFADDAKLQEWLKSFKPTDDGGAKVKGADAPKASVPATGALPDWLKSFNGVQDFEREVVEQARMLEDVPDCPQRTNRINQIHRMAEAIVHTKLMLVRMQSRDPGLMETLGPVAMGSDPLPELKKKFNRIMASRDTLEAAKGDAWRRLDLMHGLLHHNSRLDPGHQIPVPARMLFAKQSISTLNNLVAGSLGAKKSHVIEQKRDETKRKGFSASLSRVDQTLPWHDRFVKGFDSTLSYVANIRTALDALTDETDTRDCSDDFRAFSAKLEKGQRSFEELLEGLVIRRECMPEPEEGEPPRDFSDIDFLCRELKQHIHAVRVLKDVALQMCLDNHRCKDPLTAQETLFAWEQELDGPEEEGIGAAPDLNAAAPAAEPEPEPASSPPRSPAPASNDPRVQSLDGEGSAPPVASDGAPSAQAPLSAPSASEAQEARPSILSSSRQASPVASPQLSATALDEPTETDGSDSADLADEIRDLPRLDAHPEELNISLAGMTEVQIKDFASASEVAAVLIQEVNELAEATNKGIKEHSDALASLEGSNALEASIKSLDKAGELFSSLQERMQQMSDLCDLPGQPPVDQLANKAKLKKLSSTMADVKDMYHRASLRVAAFKDSPKSEVLTPDRIMALYKAGQIDIFGAEFVPDLETKRAEMVAAGLLEEPEAVAEASEEGDALPESDAAASAEGEVAMQAKPPREEPFWKIRLKVRDIEVEGAKNITFKTVVLHFHLDNVKHPDKDFRQGFLREQDLIRSACHLKPSDFSEKRVRVPPKFAIWAWRQARQADAAAERQRHEQARGGAVKKKSLPRLTFNPRPTKFTHRL